MEPIEIIEGSRFIDDRGSIKFVNGFEFADIKRFYQIENHKCGFIRAWHGRKKESKYIYVAQGVILFGVVDMQTEKMSKYILSGDQPKVLCIPPNYYHGFKTLSSNANIIFFSSSSIDEAKLDDLRLPYNKWDIWGDDYR